VGLLVKNTNNGGRMWQAILMMGAHRKEVVGGDTNNRGGYHRNVMCMIMGTAINSNLSMGIGGGAITQFMGDAHRVGLLVKNTNNGGATAGII
jgi:hypothetical protein